MSPPPPIAIPQVEPGTICEIKDVYKGKASCPCCITWSAEPQKKITTATATDTSGYAILARQTEGHGDFGRELKLHSMVIQSDLIKEVLNEVLKGYPGITTGLEHLTVEAPFAAFYHRWAELTEAYEASAGKTREHLKLLITLLEVEFEGMHKMVADLLKNGVIEYKYIWAVFQPGEHIYTTTQGQDAVMLLESGLPYDETQYGGNRGWLLSAKHIDYNGSMTGFGTTKIKIQEFKGTLALTELDAIPFDQRPDQKELVSTLVKRGRRFASLRTATFQEYSGKAVHKEESSFEGLDTQVNGRVMVDPFAYFQFNRYDQLGLHESELAELKDEDLLICVPFVRGYSFKSKEWVYLNIDNLRPVHWTEDLFSNLVLPTEEKDLLLALAKSHSRSTSHFDDFVIGKGKGMIVLLDGPPGVGKTLTAESVAEEMRAPLYTMSAGELGTQADCVEEKLGNILEMATMWNAILLIDEADIFLEQRGTGELERNELVAIFLRHLEYFKGVMILTTNRIETMDLAFDSRVDIRLHYPALDAQARRSVWLNFVRKSASIDEDGVENGGFSDDELDQLARLELNGRQIKSAMKTAHLLASGKEEVTRFEHVRTVLRITRGQIV
ncbi:putative AAA family ATPase [Acephala macrosclerotiorum]|nr:putative AAA family ATPase [Acephala macrosclerotiorum]